MKLDSVKVFVVGNPPPGYGGRYFVFLKLKTACGIEGVGEVYAATFGPKIIAAMIEDVFARRFAGRDPFQIEALWRDSYGSGFTLRPDLSLMSVVSGLEMACWDIIGKAVDQPVYQLLGGKVHERLRSYTYLYPAEGEGEDFYHDPDRSAARAAEYVKLGFTGAQVRSHRRIFRVRPAPADAGAARAHGAPGAQGARGRGRQGGSACWARTASSPPRAPCGSRSSSSPTIRSGSRSRCRPRCRRRWPRSRAPPSIPIATGERLTTKYEFARVLAARRRQHPADESRPRRGTPRGEEGGGARGGALRADRSAPVLRSGGRRGQHSDRDLHAEFPDSGKHPAMGRIPRADPEKADSLGGRLRHSADRSRARRRARRGGGAGASLRRATALHLEMANRPLG